MIETFYDEKRANRPINFIEQYCVYTTNGVSYRCGENVKLTEWQKKDIRKIYGTLSKKNKRQYRTVFLFLPKKNGKTSLAAYLALYHLFAEGEENPYILSVAADTSQAAICFNEAKKIVEQSPKLLNLTKNVTRNEIKTTKGGIYKVISSDAKTKHGFNVSCLLFDELHAQKDRELVDTLSGSGLAREQPLTFYITTAGYDKTSVCYQYYQYAKKVLKDPTVDPSFLPIIYEAPAKCDWKDPANWTKANPNYGITINTDEFEREFNKACEMPQEENRFKRLNLNLWTEQHTAWIPYHMWEDCKLVFDDQLISGLPCHAGLDLALVNDTSAFVLAFYDRWNKRCYLKPYFYIDKETVQTRSTKDGVPYDIWAKNGNLILTPGNTTDYGTIEHHIVGLIKQYSIKSIGYDPKFAGQLVQNIMQTGIKITPVAQSHKVLNPAIAEFERMLKAKELQHPDCPILNWHASNVEISTNHEGLKKYWKPHETSRIDGISGAVMAIERLIREEIDQTSEKSIYESEGILII